MAIPEGSILLKITMHIPSVFCEERVKSAVFCPLGNYDTSPKNMTPAGKKQPNSNPIRGAKNERYDVLSDFHMYVNIIVYVEICHCIETKETSEIKCLILTCER